MFKKIIITLILIIFCLGCNSTTTSTNPKGIELRNTINECEVFDCSVLDDEIGLLKYMVETNDINQGVQQNIVTTITKKCREVDITDEECKEYMIEREKLYNNKYVKEN